MDCLSSLVGFAGIGKAGRQASAWRAGREVAEAGVVI